MTSSESRPSANFQSPINQGQGKLSIDIVRGSLFCMAIQPLNMDLSNYVLFGFLLECLAW